MNTNRHGKEEEEEENYGGFAGDSPAMSAPAPFRPTQTDVADAAAHAGAPPESPAPRHLQRLAQTQE